jgi:hypothetical protein
MRRTLKELGREQIKVEKQENRAAADTFRIGEAVQFYKDGWRYGHIKAYGIGKVRGGMLQIEHPITGLLWLDATDVRHLDALKRLRLRVLSKIRLLA